MSGIVLAAWICLGLWCQVLAHQIESNVVTVPCSGHDVMAKLTGMEEVQKSMQQTLLSLHSTMAFGSNLEAKLHALETKLTATLTDTEAKLETVETELQVTKTRLESTKTTLETKLATAEAELDATKTKLTETGTALQNALVTLERKGGSTFVRWGRKSCTNSSQLVYSGVAGGSHYNYRGAAANPLCLTLQPQVDNTPVPRNNFHAWLFGAEYQEMASHHDHDVPCSVCRATQSTTIMIPTTRDCPSGWTTQYTGYLAAGRQDLQAASQYVCLDGHPEHASSVQLNEDGYLFYYTVTKCGSLPCPPYVANTVVLCVVCSK